MSYLVGMYVTYLHDSLLCTESLARSSGPSGTDIFLRSLRFRHITSTVNLKIIDIVMEIANTANSKDGDWEGRAAGPMMLQVP